jgi:hypothetical protein
MIPQTWTGDFEFTCACTTDWRAQTLTLVFKGGSAFKNNLARANKNGALDRTFSFYFLPLLFFFQHIPAVSLV